MKQLWLVECVLAPCSWAHRGTRKSGRAASTSHLADKHGIKISPDREDLLRSWEAVK